MIMNPRITVTGGRKLRRFLRTAGKGGVKMTRIGFFSTARYQNGTPVAAVAAWNEFGTRTIPERPFFRRAIKAMQPTIRSVVHQGIDPKKGIVTPELAERIGAVGQGAIQEEIVRLRQPPNAPRTVEIKGSSNPLVDTGHMRLSVTYRVDTTSE